MTDKQVQVLIGLDDDDELVADLTKYLEETGAADIDIQRNEDDRGIVPFIFLVVGAVIGAGGIAALVEYIRGKWQYEQIITFHDGVLKHQIVKIRNGKIIFIVDKDTVVETENVPEVVDFTEVAKAALTEGADLAKSMIEAAGGKAKVSSPEDDKTKDAVAKLVDRTKS